MSRVASYRPLGSTELRRRCWHIGAGFLPLLLWFVPHRDPLGPVAQLAILGVGLLVGGFILARYRRIARPGDAERIPSVGGYVAAVLGTILLFPGDVQIGLVVLAVLAFGDGSATAGGRMFGGRPLPWNPDKTWTGLVCFLCVGTSAAAVIHWGETAFNPFSSPAVVPFGVSLAVGAATAFAGAIAESVRSPVNDNIRVGLTAALTAASTHLMLVDA